MALLTHYVLGVVFAIILAVIIGIFLIVVAFQPSVNYDIQFTGGIKNTLFGGEGLFLATLTGPGKIYLQSLPFSRLADRIYAAAPKAGGSRREEGSILGGLGGLLNGDNH